MDYYDGLIRFAQNADRTTVVVLAIAWAAGLVGLVAFLTM